eukprot:gene6821-4901_t
MPLSPTPLTAATEHSTYAYRTKTGLPPNVAPAAAYLSNTHTPTLSTMSTPTLFCNRLCPYRSTADTKEDIMTTEKKEKEDDTRRKYAVSVKDKTNINKRTVFKTQPDPLHNSYGSTTQNASIGDRLKNTVGCFPTTPKLIQQLIKGASHLRLLYSASNMNLENRAVSPTGCTYLLFSMTTTLLIALYHVIALSFLTPVGCSDSSPGAPSPEVADIYEISSVCLSGSSCLFVCLFQLFLFYLGIYSRVEELMCYCCCCMGVLYIYIKTVKPYFPFKYEDCTALHSPPPFYFCSPSSAPIWEMSLLNSSSSSLPLFLLFGFVSCCFIFNHHPSRASPAPHLQSSTELGAVTYFVFGG